MCGRIRTQRSRRMLVGLAVAAVAVLGSAGSASATSLSYAFDFGNQGWMQKQDVASASSDPAGFLATGGNPGGHLSALDTGEEKGCPGIQNCELLAFYSPFFPTLGANYGGTASFDLRSEDVDPEFGADLLLLPSGDSYLDGFIPESKGMTYHHLSIPLVETARLTENLAWAVCPYAGGACSAANRGQFQSMLATTDEIAAIVDVGPNGTGETYDLDNFTLTDGQPQPPASPPAKHKKCKKKKHRGKHRAAAKKCKKKKKQHRRAAVARLRG